MRGFVGMAWVNIKSNTMVEDQPFLSITMRRRLNFNEYISNFTVVLHNTNFLDYLIKIMLIKVFKLFTESLTRCPVIGWKTANHRLPFLDFLQTPMRTFPTNALTLFPSVIPQNQDVLARSLSLLDANTCLCGFFQQLRHKKEGSIFVNPTKRTQEIQTVKRTPFTEKFPTNQVFARTKFSFLSFYVNISFL